MNVKSFERMGERGKNVTYTFSMFLCRRFLSCFFFIFDEVRVREQCKHTYIYAQHHV